MMQDPLLGAWRLVTMSLRDADGVEIPNPDWANPQGVLIYDASGIMSAHVTFERVPDFHSQDMRAATAAEALRAFLAYTGYYGTWRREGDKIIHKVIGSLFPNMNGHEMIRYPELVDDRLIMTAAPQEIGGQCIVFKVVWRKSSPVP